MSGQRLQDTKQRQVLSRALKSPPLLLGLGLCGIRKIRTCTSCFKDLKPSPIASDSAAVMADHQADAPIPEEYQEDVWFPAPPPPPPPPPLRKKGLGFNWGPFACRHTQCRLLRRNAEPELS